VYRETGNAELVNTYPSIQEVWLIGSRANNRARNDSDWDYMVFGDDYGLLNTSCQDGRFNQPGIDVLFLRTPDVASSPWLDDGYRKSLGLGDTPGGIQWTVISDAEAPFVEAKDGNRDKPHELASD
jgi:hypothetical protein